MLVALTAAIEARDPYGRGHSERVAELAEALGACLGWDEQRLATLRLGARLHDIGKVVVPRRILEKAGPLDELERRQVEIHPLAGARLVVCAGSARAALACVLYHHERWDGRGYPAGRSGGAIPLEARLLAVADAFDAMTSTRPYRRALSTERALDELRRCAGSQFDPELAGAFVEAWSTGRLRRAEAS